MVDLGTISRIPSESELVMPTGVVVLGRRERSVLPLLHGRKTGLFDERIEGRRFGRDENVLWVIYNLAFLRLSKDIDKELYVPFRGQCPCDL